MLFPGAEEHELVVLFGQIALHLPHLSAISFFFFLVSCICVQLIDISITKIPFPFAHSADCHHSRSSELLISLSISLRMEGLPFKILLESLATEQYSIPSLDKHFTRIKFQTILHIS